MGGQQGMEPGVQVTPRGMHTSTGAVGREAGGAAGTMAGGGTAGAGMVDCAGSTRGCAATLAGKMSVAASTAARMPRVVIGAS
jgi:hypothetical protein